MLPNFLLWKFSAKAHFPHSFCGNCAFPQNFYSRKLSETTVFFAVICWIVSNWPLFLISFTIMSYKSVLTVNTTYDFNLYAMLVQVKLSHFAPSFAPILFIFWQRIFFSKRSNTVPYYWLLSIDCSIRLWLLAFAFSTKI